MIKGATNPDFLNKPRKGIMIVHRLNQKSYKNKLESFLCNRFNDNSIFNSLSFQLLTMANFVFRFPISRSIFILKGQRYSDIHPNVVERKHSFKIRL